MKNRQEHWIKQVYGTLSQARQIPMWGSLPSFDWTKFSSAFAEAFALEGMDIEASTPDWIDAKERLPSLKKTNSYEVIKISPLNGQILWIMTIADREKLSSLLLSSSSSKGFSDPRFQEGFYKYVMLEVLHCFDKVGSYPELHPRLEEGDIDAENFCVVPVSLKCNNTTIWGKLAISSELQEAIKQQYASKLQSLATHPLASDLQVLLKMQVANTSLLLHEWKEIKVGDCILLDRCSFDPVSYKGSITICLEETPIFRAKLKKNSLKIQDYAFYQEEENPMSDEELPPEEESIQEDFTEDESLSESEDELPEELQEAMEEEEDRLHSEEPGTNATTEKLISSQKIPLTLVIEVDRIRMSLDKLLQLAPGNVLDLSVRPEQGVYVTIGGKKVAHGEIIKLGDALGLKILQLGDSGE